MNRENGFYWVQYVGEWKVAEWEDGHWYLPGLENIFEDTDFTQIGNYRLRIKLLP